MLWACLQDNSERVVLKLGFPTNQTEFSCSAGQRDNGTDVPSFSRNKGTTGQAQNLAMCQDGPGQDKHFFFVKILYRTQDRMGQYFFPLFLFQNVLFLFQNNLSCFRTSFSCFVPGFLLLLLSKDKGTAEQGNFFVSGQRDSGTRLIFCPGTKGQQDKDFFCRGTSRRPIPYCPGTSRPVPWKP